MAAPNGNYHFFDQQYHNLETRQPGGQQAPTAPGPHPQAASTEPWVEIIEQPKSKGFRFRYECEGRSAGSIPGERSTPENKSYPTIKIHNIDSDAIVVVSTVTKEIPPHCKPHPHSLVGKDCERGVCTVRLKKNNVASFPNLGIQCAKKKEVAKSLKERKDIRVDPFNNGNQIDDNNIDLTVARLCFQVFLPDAQHRFQKHVPPVVTNCIYDKKAISDLVICRISKQAGTVKGNDEVFMLCEKVSKDDIQVRFYEEDHNGVRWEEQGVFGMQDVHRQYAIVMRTPPYHNLAIQQPVTVKVQLKRPSDGQTSDPIDFQYIPGENDPHRLDDKRKRKRLSCDDDPDIKEEAVDSKAAIREMINQKQLGGQSYPPPPRPDSASNASYGYMSPGQDITNQMDNMALVGSPAFTGSVASPLGGVASPVGGAGDSNAATPQQVLANHVIVQPVASEEVAVLDPSQISGIEEDTSMLSATGRFDSNDLRVDSDNLRQMETNVAQGEFVKFLDKEEKK